MTVQDQDTKFEWKNGRLLAEDQHVSYILPSDQTEVDRLELNHNLWKNVMNGLFKSPLHEKLTQGIRVLDIGCGPGWWTRDMAKLYPNSEFIGIDMAKFFVTKDLPSNVTFKNMNITTGLNFQDEHFDFVFQRFLVMGLPPDQYKQCLKEIKRILKPGGSIEIIELVNDYAKAGPAFKQISEWSKNMDSFIADKISGFFSDTGFIDIKDKNYNVPIGTWGNETGKAFLEIQKLALPAVQVMVTQLTPVTAEEYEKTMKEAFEEVERYTISTRFRLIYAIKP
ncbi:S-adenosyl-L-methionine-dependent methyltransferase [Backusella circina FSU 941]|nr:S-adenosyl-L-methionine-dependent methyltransferase [Backusella circina FSU 941]